MNTKQSAGVYLYLFASCLSVCLHITLQDFGSNRTTDLYVLALLPCLDTSQHVCSSWVQGPDILPAVELAVEQINNRSDILRWYKLHLVSGDGGCHVDSKAAVSFVEHVLPPARGVVAILGPGCSASSIAISSLISKNATALVAVHLGTADILGNHAHYPNSFGILGPSQSYIKAIINLLQVNKWRNVSALYDSKSFFYRSAFKDFKSKLPENISSISFFSDVFDASITLTVIRETLTRVILVFAGPYYARKVICMAYHEGLVYPTFQWIFVHGDLSEFIHGEVLIFSYNQKVYNCTREEILIALERGLMVRFKVLPTDPNSTTSFGVTYNSYLELYRQRMEKASYCCAQVTPSVLAAPAYDAVWALAVALNNSEVDLAEYHHGEPDKTRMIRDQRHKLDFKGVSGQVKFDQATGYANREVGIYQIFSTWENYIAHYNGQNITIFNREQAEFVDNNFPLAQNVVNRPLAMIFLTLTAIQLMLVATSHLISMFYRKYRSIKASSPRLNHILYSGCYVMIVGTFIFILLKAFSGDAKRDATICQAMWAWLLPIGYTLIFGTIMGRTWRIYRIFICFNNPGQFISDLTLFALILFLLTIDFIIGITWTATDPFKVVYVKRWFVVKESQAQSVVVDSFCDVNHPACWHTVPLGYKIFILIIVVALSLLSRSIKHKNFTTRSLTILVYSQAFILGLGFPIYAFLRYMYVNNNIDFVILCVMLNAIILCCLVLVLIPPVAPLLIEKYRKIRNRYML